jgi:hypothetical protein
MTKKIATVKFKKSSTSGVGAAKGSSGVTPEQLAALVKASSVMGQASGGGRTWTQADSDATVQSVFQQLLGRNAQGTEYAKALSLLNTAAGSSAGMTNAVTQYVESLPEYQARTQDKWLGAIYDDLQRQMQEANA